MYERLTDKNKEPTMDEFLDNMGICRELFEDIDGFLVNELNLEKTLRFQRADADSWSIKYNRKTKYFCDITSEKDAFTVTMRLSDDQIQRAYKIVNSYAKERLDNYHRTSNGGWVQYRVLNMEHLIDAKKILVIRNK